MSYLDRLPDVILDEIFSYYWTDVFKQTVIKENNYLNKIKANKGIVLLIKIKFKNHPINYIFNDNPYINFPEWCKYIAIYTISKSGVMRYYIENAIKKLEKPTF